MTIVNQEKPMDGAAHPFSEADTIHTYSRAEALDDGFLVDVSEVAREAGFTVPVALTRAVWENCVAWDEQDSKRQTYQDENGRLWDVLYMAALYARANKSANLFHFVLHRVPRGGRGRIPRRVILKVKVGPGDTMEPVITIMEKDED